MELKPDFSLKQVPPITSPPEFPEFTPFELVLPATDRVARAVRQSQSTRGLKADGIVGPLTLAALPEGGRCRHFGWDLPAMW